MLEIDFTWSKANANTRRILILLATCTETQLYFHSTFAVNQYILLVFSQLSNLISFAYSFVWIGIHHRICIELILIRPHTKDANENDQ